MVQGRLRTAVPTRRVTAGLGVLALALGPVAYGSEAAGDVVEVRGEQWSVWPADDLRARGLDVQELSHQENAAWVYLEAWNGYLDLPEALTGAFDYAVGTAWPQDQRGLEEWLMRAENREAIQAASKAARMPRCQLPYFGDPDGSIVSVLLPSLRHHRAVAKLVVADGRRLAAQKDYRGAMERFATAMRMGAHMEQGITLIEPLVGVACWNLGRAAMLDLVLRSEMSKEDWAAVSKEWNDLRRLTPTLQRGFEGERLFGPSIVDEMVSRPSQLLKYNLEGQSGFDGMPTQVRSKDGWDRLEARLGRLFLPDRTIKRHLTEYYDAVLEVFRLPYYDERVESFDEEQHVLAIPRWDVLGRTLLPSLSRARLLGERCRTETRATSVALALQQYARSHQGRHPALLSDLAGEGDSQDLIDPFSGNEFVYTRTAGGWKFYSVGPDRADNGGKAGERWDEVGTDVVYRYPPEPLTPFDEPQEEN